MKLFCKIFLTVLFTTSLFAQTSIAVLELEGKGLSEMEASILTDRLRNELFQTGKYRVIERELMGAIMKEQGFQLSECTSTECMVEIGQLLGVDQMIGGSVSKFGTMYSVAVRLVSVETGEFLGTATYDHEGRIEDLLKVGMKAVSNKLSGFEKSGEKTEVAITPVEQPVIKEQPPYQQQSKTVKSETPQTDSVKPLPTYQASKPKRDFPFIMLRSELGVFGLSDQDIKDIYDGTAGPLFGLSAVLNIIKIPNLGAVGLYSGVQSTVLLLSPQDTDQYGDWERQDLYIMTKIGLQGLTASKSKLSATISVGYMALSSATVFTDEWGEVSDPYQDTAGGLFTDLLFSFRPIDAFNLTLDFGFGTTATNKDNIYGGNKFVIGGSINF